MNKPRTSTLGFPVAVVFAATITIVSVWLLSMLNARVMPERPVPAPIRTVMIRGRSAEPVRRTQPTQRPIPTPAPSEQMMATMETPTVAPISPPPLSLQIDLPEPELESVEITIFQPPEQRPELKPLEMNLDKVAAERTTQQVLPTVVPRQSVPLPTANRSRLDSSHRTTSAPTKSVVRARTAPAVAMTTEVASINTRSLKPARSSAPNTSTTTSSAAVIHRADRVDQGPQESSGNSQPAYPTRERNLGIEGSVLVKLLIDEKGQVKDAQVLRGPEAFRQSVLSVAFDWKFSPAQHEGRPVKVWGVKEVRFQLRTQ